MRNWLPVALALQEHINEAVDTVERSQGQERTAIVTSYAVSDPDTIADEAEFIQNLNCSNVLATRAQAKLVVRLSDEVVKHIAADLNIIRSSKLLKAFADTYCNQRIPFTADDTPPGGQARIVDAVLRHP